MHARFDPMFFFFLAVLGYLIAWAGSIALVRLPDNPSAAAVWNKAWAIFTLIAGIIAVIILIVRAV